MEAPSDPISQIGPGIDDSHSTYGLLDRVATASQALGGQVGPKDLIPDSQKPVLESGFEQWGEKPGAELSVKEVTEKMGELIKGDEYTPNSFARKILNLRNYKMSHKGANQQDLKSAA